MNSNTDKCRLSYSSTSNRGIQKELTVELNDTVSKYRFSELDENTYYTFTIITIVGPINAEAESDSIQLTVGFHSRRMLLWAIYTPTKYRTKYHCHFAMFWFIITNSTNSFKHCFDFFSIMLLRLSDELVWTSFIFSIVSELGEFIKFGHSIP